MEPTCVSPSVLAVADCSNYPYLELPKSAVFFAGSLCLPYWGLECRLRVILSSFPQHELAAGVQSSRHKNLTEKSSASPKIRPKGSR